MMFTQRIASRLDASISGLGLGIALLACVGCGGGHDSGSAGSTLTPGPPRATHTPIRAAFTATPAGTVLRTATPTQSGSGLPATPTTTTTAPTTPGTETVTPTVSVTPTWTPPADPHGVLRIGRVSGEPGTIVSIDVTLSEVDQGVDIAGTQNDLSFDPAAIAVVENTDGDPDCAVNPAIDKGGTAFAFQPPDCGASGSCRGMRAIVVSFTNSDPIASGSRLYTCNVAISAAAPPGAVYALPCSSALAGSPDGRSIDLACEDGEIEIEGGPPVPTPTPDSSFVPTLTPTPARTACITQTPGSCEGLARR